MQHSFWAHYCPCEKGVLWVAHDEECNWCGLTCDPVVAEGEPDPFTASCDVSTAGKSDGRAPGAKRLRD